MFELPSSQSQASPLRLSLVGQNSNRSISSQKNKRKSNSIAGPSSLDEENRLQISANLFVDTTDCDLSLESSFKQHITKSPRLEKSIETNKVNINKSLNPTLSPFRNNNNINMMEDYTVPAIDTLNEDLKSSFIDSHPSPNGSECGTEISSVSQRREWLKSFEKKQSSNIFRSMINDKGPETIQTRQNDDRHKKEARVAAAVKDARQSPPASPKSSISFSNGFSNSRYPMGVTNSATKPKQRKPVINRRASSSMMSSWKVKNHEGVQATDEGYASVASLSKWLESDPTTAKKMRHVRRGRNIISKSRQFEKDQGDVIIMESNISRGAVGDKKKWLKNAFQFTEEEDPDDDASSTYSGYVQSDVGRPVRAHPRFNRPGAQTEIITDDAASSLSISDKKDWLKNAFSKNSEERKTLGYAKAGTDVMPNRGQSRDETASRAKLMFKQRSTRKLAPASPPRTSFKAVKSKEPVALVSSINSDVGTTPIATKYNDMAKPERTTATKPEELVFKVKNAVQITESTEEEKAPVDFRSARDVLIERSKKNGHNTKVVNKVFLRKKKFEKLEEESRRQSIGVGLVLKTSWDLTDTSTGRPSNAYEKKYVQAQIIAPKKSFEDLP